MGEKVQIGRLDRKVSFQTVTSTKSGMGGAVKTYTHSFYWYMSREQSQSGQEQYIGSRLVVPMRFTYKGHYKSSINETMMIVDAEIKYNIVWVNPTDGNKFIEILAERVIE